MKRNLGQCTRALSRERVLMQTAKQLDLDAVHPPEVSPTDLSAKKESPNVIGEMFPTSRVVPMVLSNKEPVVLSFDSVPGPKSLKYLSGFRSYLSEIGTQLTAGILTLGLNLSK